MKNYSGCSVLIPCHSLEDFPTHHSGNHADDLLACWTTIWHPALIASSGSAPKLLRAGIDEIETDLALVVIPNISRDNLSDSFIASAQQHRATLIGAVPDNWETPIAINTGATTALKPSVRAVLIAQAIAANDAATVANQNIPAELAAEFLALGYGYLQVQLMTRQLRYSSNLDQAGFDERLVAAAVSAAAGKTDQAREDLSVCFDWLLEEKNNYYPVQPQLIDIVLLAETTLKNSLNEQLQSTSCQNFLLTGTLANQLAEINPQAVETLKQQILSERASLIGGLESELADPLLSCETVVRQFVSGQQTVQRLFDFRPTVFFRRRFGLSPTIPGLLDQFDFAGAIHATLDDGKFPIGHSAHIRWTGHDGQSISAYGLVPLDADDAGSLLRLGLSIGEQIDSAHTATLLFAHWPNRTCDAFQDLMRIAQFGNLFGRFVRFDEYFETVYDPGYGDTFDIADYVSPYLKQAIETIQPNPISRYVNYWHGQFQLSAARALLLQQAIAQHSLPATETRALPPTMSQQWQRIETLEAELDRGVDAFSIANLTQTVAEITTLVSTLTSLGSALSVTNPLNFKRRVHLQTLNSEISDRYSIKSLRHTGAILFADRGAEQTDWIIELPAMSVAAISHGLADTETELIPKTALLSRPTKLTDPLRSDPPVLDDGRLQNEFFELTIDPQTGGIRSIRLHNGRTNLISQQLAIRIPTRNSAGQPLSRARYTTMQVDKISMHATSRINGSVTTCGRLVDGENVLANFKQTVQMSRGIPLAQLEIELELLTELTGGMHHYACNRMAWKEDASTVTANFQHARQTVYADWFLATQYIQIAQGERTVTLLTGGLPHHRRVSRRMIDSVLVVGNECCRKFSLAIGIDLPYPLAAAADWQTGPMIEPISINQKSIMTNQEKPSSPGNQRDWLFHFDCRNILVTSWQPIFENERLIGWQLRLLETAGRAGQLTIRNPLPIRHAARVNFNGDFLRSIEILTDEPNAVVTKFSADEYFQLSLEI